MGLEAIEQIEVIAAELAAGCSVRRYAEVRVGSGALANLYAFMATCRPATRSSRRRPIGGHITHHAGGRRGPVWAERPCRAGRRRHFTVDVAGLAALAGDVRPKLITIGAA